MRNKFQLVSFEFTIKTVFFVSSQDEKFKLENQERIFMRRKSFDSISPRSIKEF